MVKDPELHRMRHIILNEHLKKIKYTWIRQEHIDEIHTGIDTMVESASITVSLRGGTRYLLSLHITWVEDTWVVAKIEVIRTVRTSLKKLELFTQGNETDLESVFAQMLLGG